VSKKTCELRKQVEAARHDVEVISHSIGSLQIAAGNGWSTCVLHPEKTQRLRRWDIVTTAALVYTCTLTPFEAAFSVDLYMAARESEEAAATAAGGASGGATARVAERLSVVRALRVVRLPCVTPSPHSRGRPVPSPLAPPSPHRSPCSSRPAPSRRARCMPTAFSPRWRGSAVAPPATVLAALIALFVGIHWYAPPRPTHCARTRHCHVYPLLSATALTVPAFATAFVHSSH
jgi:hypothetical protein